MENEPKNVPMTELLDSQECWSLLRQVSVGRLAVWLGDGPDIFPVNYTTDHGTVVFRTGTGTKLEAALGDFPVAMEADGVNPDNGVAWSVVLRGKAELLTRTEDVLNTFSLPLFPWEAGKKDHFVRVVPARSQDGASPWRLPICGGLPPRVPNVQPLNDLRKRRSRDSAQ